MRTTVVAGGNGQLTRFGVQGPKSSETFALPTKPELIWPTDQAEKSDLVCQTIGEAGMVGQDRRGVGSVLS